MFYYLINRNYFQHVLAQLIIKTQIVDLCYDLIRFYEKKNYYDNATLSKKLRL